MLKSKRYCVLLRNLAAAGITAVINAATQEVMRWKSVTMAECTHVLQPTLLKSKCAIGERKRAALNTLADARIPTFINGVCTTCLYGKCCVSGTGFNALHHIGLSVIHLELILTGGNHPFYNSGPKVTGLS